MRNGTAKGIMSMSKENSTRLWNSVQDSMMPTAKLHNTSLIYLTVDDFQSYLRVTAPLMNPANPLRNIPLRVYIPSSPVASSNPSTPTKAPNPPTFEFKIIQTLIPPHTFNREVQTLGSALNGILPELFPSRRDPVLAEVVIHGAALPFRAPLEQVMKECAYADGWIAVVVRMVDA